MLTSSNYFTTRQAALLLSVSVPTVQKWVETGLLKSWKTEGGHRRIHRAAVLEMVQQQREKDAAAEAPQALAVLVVEDDPNLIQLYKLQMGRWPFPVTVYVAPNGYEGLVMVGEVNPGLLVCDLRLPGVNGFNIVRALCQIERFNRMVVVVISGMPREEIDAHGGLPPRVVLMGKPVSFAQLQDIAAQQWQEKMKT